MSVTLHIPDDPSECQRLLADLLCRNDALRQQAQTAGQRADDAQQRADDAQRRIDELERVLDQTAADYDQLKQQHAELAETLAAAAPLPLRPAPRTLPRRPGPRSSLRHPRVHRRARAGRTPCPADDAAPPPPKAARTPRRTRLDHLPHIRIEHDLPEPEKTCSCCGGPKQRIGEDESRELDFIPARLEVKVHILPKYACPKCRDGVASPPVPPKPVPGGIAGAGLVAFVVVSKFADHLPLYRLEDILTRQRRVSWRGAPCATGSATPPYCSSPWPSCRSPWCCGRRSSGPTTPV